MEMVVFENEPEVLMENISNKGHRDTSAAPGLKLYRCVAVSFGLLCILQVALNISLRLSLNCEARTKQLTEERDELKGKLNDSILGHEAEIKILTGQKDELKRRLDDINQLLKEGWKYFCSSLYYVSSTRKTWQKSRNDCLSRGADLMIIDSREEQDFLRRLSKEMWIGLTDGAQEGTWRWVDGTLLNTSYWIPGQPDNNDKGKEENCAEIHICGSWNDKSCGLQNHWICEKKVAP
ncbi:CD209 antigen-like protein C [Salarias fasciatus]|uniref:CD209 antigen-like protein C n=1 Tax=Salarias fasciatus TaxID=181472 RepID=UPI0011767335|nr:CD209 antigen-like protein C [Salarias fasciatus]